MAGVTLRGSEVEAVKAILTDDSYADEDAMTRAILKAVYSLWRQREWYATGVKLRGVPVALYGLEATEHGAWQMAAGLPYQDLSVFRIGSFDQYQAIKEQAIVDAEVLPDPNCVTCGHGAWAHFFVGANGKRTSPKQGSPSCSASCDCTQYIPEKR